MTTPAQTVVTNVQPAGALLRLIGVTKRFPGTLALDDISLEVAQGEIHALVGQNGSGKSTLIKVLAGYHHADPGAQAWLAGEAIDLSSAGRLQHQRMRFVHQDLGLFEELSVVDNIALRSTFLTDAVHLVRWRAQHEVTHEFLGQFGLDLDLSNPVQEATPVQRTVVAIAAALVGWGDGPGLLVLDEPTAVLPPHDVERLLEIIEGVRDRGTSILYVSHRLDEVIRVADRVTVLRGGRVVETRSAAGLTQQALAQLMVGPDVDAGYRSGLQPVAAEQPVILRARNLGGRFLAGMDMELREGEVLGVAGLPGSGREELPYVLAGALPGASGQIQLAGQPWLPARKSAAFKVPIVPADRGREAVIREFSVAENLTLSIIGQFRRLGLQRPRRERASVRQWMKTVSIHAQGPDALVTTLSGGNQQKVIMARCLASDPRVLLLCEPTAGVDVGTRQAIYEFIAERARQGLSLVVSSTDIGDLLALCTRVLVMCNGHVVRELSGADITETALVNAMEETEQV